MTKQETNLALHIASTELLTTSGYVDWLLRGDWFKSPESNVPLWNETTYPNGSFVPFDSRGRPRKKHRL